MSENSSAYSRAMDKEALFPLLAAALPVAGKTALSALYALWAAQAGKQLVTKNIPGIFQGLASGDLKKAGGNALHAGVNVSMMVPGLGAVKTFRNAPRLYKMNKLFGTAPIRGRMTDLLARNVKAGTGPQTLGALRSQWMQGQGGPLFARTPIGLTTAQKAEYAQSVAGLRGMRDATQAFNKGFDKNVYGRIPGYRWFEKSRLNKPWITLPALIGGGMTAEALAPTAAGPMGGVNKALAATEAMNAYGPGGQMAVPSAAYAAFFGGLGQNMHGSNEPPNSRMRQFRGTFA